jgi:hypothetical protein
METILSILSELEYFENLVKLIRKKCDENTITTNVIGVEGMLTIRKICINKSHHNKTLHLLVRINNNLIEGLVDTWASMFVMAIGVVREIMNLVIDFESYKTTSGVITQTLHTDHKPLEWLVIVQMHMARGVDGSTCSKTLALRQYIMLGQSIVM